MSAQRTEPNAEQSVDQPTDGRSFPAERAFSGPHDEPAWRRVESSPSVGWQEMYHEMHCELPYLVDPDEVTSS
ncbi:hypothetical protein RBH20_09825 [Haloarcula sp. H-GB4]|uniref:hypothetical protein n=1 Tax=Haloarcula sp. H-GB4 TaxID=3069755 RepID=UPI0027B01EB0|nr:hypothetical protein [Haloarcula sp. H-GB4]MDQ2072832.1 hypothetical protein [Haloarcula sp. H-GB4]